MTAPGFTHANCKLLPFDKHLPVSSFSFLIHWCLVPNVSSSSAQNPHGRPWSAHLCVWLVSLPLSNSLDSNLNRIFSLPWKGKPCSLTESNFTWIGFWNSVCSAFLNLWRASDQYLDSLYYAHLCQLERMLPLLHIALSMLSYSVCHWANIFILSKQLFYYNTPQPKCYWNFSFWFRKLNLIIQSQL